MRQRGAALLLAMLTVAMVATLASAALWRQWRNIEIQSVEQQRSQAIWVLEGALDWARLILREDARNSGPDHLAEPWAVVLQESRLSTFLAIDGDTTDLAQEAFLSGQITDAQAKMNVTNLIAERKISEPDMEAFTRLFDMLGLDHAELATLADQLLLSITGNTDAETVRAVPLRPRRVEQLAWLGLSPASALILAPHIVVLPTRTTLNLNTASAEVIAARIPDMELADARKLLAARSRTPFRSLADVQRLLNPAAPALDAAQYSLGTRYFEVRGQLRLDKLVFEERSLLQRNGLDVLTLWRDHGAPPPVVTGLR